MDGSTGECNVSTVAESVKKQVGFEVVLLDSKLYPVTDNESTSGPEFWRSTRKRIAASRASYEKLVGMSVGDELSQLDDDVVITEPPSKRVKKMAIEDLGVKVEEIDKKLDAIDRKLSVFDDIKKTFECVICRSVVRYPMVSLCCKRIIGCKRCVSTWRTTSTRCPLCSDAGEKSQPMFALKGIDDLTALFCDRVPPIHESSESSVSSDDFEDLPPFPTTHT